MYVIYSCDVKVNFQKPLFQSSVARDSIINVENNCAAQYFLNIWVDICL